VAARVGGPASITTDGGLSLVAADRSFVAGERVWVGVRPERMTIGGAGENRLHGVLEDEVYLGDRTQWRVKVGETVLVVAEGALAPPRRRGDAVEVTFAADAVLRLGDT
jgi:ABC-type Fe3+/spermidine/putrescine transport system ATPase subunit